MSCLFTSVSCQLERECDTFTLQDHQVDSDSDADAASEGRLHWALLLFRSLSRARDDLQVREGDDEAFVTGLRCNNIPGRERGRNAELPLPATALLYLPSDLTPGTCSGAYHPCVCHGRGVHSVIRGRPAFAAPPGRLYCSSGIADCRLGACVW